MPNKMEIEELAKLGEKIHKIMNETVYRKLTLKEYRIVINLIGRVFDEAQDSHE